MIDLHEKLVRVERVRYVALPEVAGEVRQRDVLVEDPCCNRINAVGADHMLYPGAEEWRPLRKSRRNSCGIFRRTISGCSEITDPFRCRGHPRAGQKGVRDLA